MKLFSKKMLSELVKKTTKGVYVAMQAIFTMLTSANNVLVIVELEKNNNLATAHLFS